MTDINQVLRAAHQHKTAAIGPAEIEQEMGNLLREEAFGKLKNILAATAGVGIAGRGGLGLINMLRRNFSQPKAAPSGQNVINIPTKQEKQANSSSLQSILDWLKSYASGNKATQIGGIPWFTPAALATGGAGMYGGWKLTDKLLDSRRNADLDAELSTARNEYEQALSGSAKTAADGTLAKDLDLLAEAYEKQASVNDITGALTGVGLSAAGLAALLSGLAGYHHGKSNSRRSILEKARKKQLGKQLPAPIYMQAAPAVQETDNELA